MDNVPDTVFSHVEVIRQIIFNTNMAVPFNFIVKRMTELFPECCYIVEESKNNSPLEIDWLHFKRKV